MKWKDQRFHGNKSQFRVSIKNNVSSNCGCVKDLTKFDLNDGTTMQSMIKSFNHCCVSYANPCIWIMSKEMRQNEIENVGMKGLFKQCTALVLLLLGKPVLLIFHEFIANSLNYLMEISSSLFLTCTTQLRVVLDLWLSATANTFVKWLY